MKSLPKMIKGILIMLTFQFVFGMVINLWGVPPKEETATNHAPVFASMSFASHALLALAIVITSLIVFILSLQSEKSQVKRMGIVSFVFTVLTFTAGIMTIVLEGNIAEIMSFIMAIGFLLLMALYGRLYSMVGK